MKRSLFLTLTVFTLAGILGTGMQVHAAEADSMAGIVSTTDGRLNVRSSATTSAPAVGSLNRGSYITLLSKAGAWWEVEYADGKKGYCHGDYISITDSRSTTVNTVSTGLNVRSGPGTQYPKTGTLPKGETVLILAESGGWSRILYAGTKTGYVSTRYLSSGLNAISLNVPDYKQTDARWANVQIASSGKTMAQIGCATTAIAMLESHRTGTDIYPDELARILRYTPSGSVYWPDHYTAVTEDTDLLNRLLTLLKQGKPILLGAKNNGGKQHWVVVYGYSGGGSLSAPGFRIHDPGSRSRTDLGQFLEQYPYLYKYFHT